jgi:hypothetical protein
LHALAVFDDGSGPALYAAGKFHGIGGQNAGGIARWNGASWSALGSGVYGGVVYTLAAFDDGSGPKLYAGGSFTNAGSLAVNGIARWHPSSGWTTPGSTTFADLVHSMTVHDDGSGAQLYASGLFDPSGSFPGGELARWNGSSWSAVGTGAPTGVRAFATFDDGSGPALYAGGSINVGGTYPGIARWDGSVWSTLGSGLFLAPMHSPTGGALAVVPDPVDGVPDLYVGGDFVLAGGQTSHNIARWNGCPTGDAFCAGDGSLAQACPCANTGVAGRGCENSAATGGARLAASGSPFADNVVLTSSGELPSALSIFLQGNVDLSASSGAVVFGDGVRCVGGALKRLYADNAENGAVSAPGAGELSIQQKSAALGDPIAPGSTRWYQVYYRDPNVAFCPAPAGNTWNVSSGVRVTW